MHLAKSRRAARWLLACLGLWALVVALLWLALPRLLGLAAERWISMPGLEALHVDIESLGSGRARLREVRAVYQSAGGQRAQIALYDIAIDYSLAGRHLERLNIARGELDVFPGQTPQASAWPQLEWPQLPVSEAHVDDLRMIVHWPGRAPLAARGKLLLQRTPGQWQAEFRPDAGLLRMTARQAPVHPSLAGDALEFHVEWLPAAGAAAEAKLHMASHPGQHPARLVARLPLPVLAVLGRYLDLGVPPAAASGTVELRVQAQLGETAGTLSTLSGEAEFTDAGLQAISIDRRLAFSLAGRLSFAWQPSAARIELMPGWRWQLSVDDENSLHASGQVDRAFAIRREQDKVFSEGEFPFLLRSPQWGRWDGALRRVDLHAGAGLADWRSADMQLRIKGRLTQWQRDAMAVRGVRAAGDVALHWSAPASLRGDLALQVGVDRLSWSGSSPLSVADSAWQVSADAAADAGSDFWKSLVVQGQARSPQLKVEQGRALALTLGPTRLQLQQLSLAGRRGELLLTADALRFDHWPAPDLHARLRLDGNALRADGALLAHGSEVLRLAGTHRLDSACGEATLALQQTLPTLAKLLQPRPPAWQPLNFTAGDAQGRLSMDWCSRPQPRFDAKGSLRLRDAGLGWDRARLDALQAVLQLDGLHPLRGRIQLVARRGELATGTPLSDLGVDLALAPPTLTVHGLHVNLLGGSVHGEPQSLSWPPAEQALPLEIRQIDLAQLLALFKVDGLSGSGQLSGVMPLAYGDGGVELRDGTLNSAGAGTIKYAPGLTIPDNPGLQALRNFHFRQLGMHLWYERNGIYRTQTTLEGSNPDFYSGYPLRFGLNINGELPGLFRSALFSGDFNRHIMEQLQSGKLE